MLVSAVTYRVLMYGALALAGVWLLVGGVAGEIAERRARVPGAELANRRVRRGVAKLVVAIGAIASLGAAWWIYRHASDVVFFRDGADEPTSDRRVYLGARDHFRASDDVGCGRDPTWIVNESTRTVEVRTIGYGLSHTPTPATLVPHATGCAKSVDHIGPSDAPPDEVEVTTTDELRRNDLVGARRVWVTW